jgi:hypothetical protein
VTVSNAGTVDASFNITVKWGTTTIAQMSETLPAGQQKSYPFSWSTTGSNAATDVITTSITQDGIWSSSGSPTLYALTTPAPFFTSTNIVAIGAVVAALVLLTLILLLRRRTRPATP